MKKGNVSAAMEAMMAEFEKDADDMMKEMEVRRQKMMGKIAIRKAAMDKMMGEE